MRLITILMTLIAMSATAEIKTEDDPAKTYLDNAFQDGNLFIGGQPTSSEVKDLKSHGVDLVINLRTESEMSNLDFNQEQLLKRSETQYLQLPVSGNSSFTPELLESFAKAYESKEKVLLHCRSGRRASFLWAAYQVKYKNKDINEALKSVTEYGWWPLPIESMLETELEVSLKKL
jgi:uncharacterized protein (TIGR01244 family)